MKPLIIDANIIIDMDDGGLVEAMFKLPQTFAVPNVLFMEELVDHHPELPGLGLLVLELSEQTVAETLRLHQQNSNPSVNDLMALALAKQESCPLLTGDRRLRAVAEEEGIESRGTLWLMDEMFQVGIINRKQAKAAYKKMRESDRRLPWDEVDEQLKRFK